MDHPSLQARGRTGCGLGDAASHIVFDIVMFRLPFFYTDNRGSRMTIQLLECMPMHRGEWPEIANRVMEPWR
jgi:hypothetical protein